MKLPSLVPSGSLSQLFCRGYNWVDTWRMLVQSPFHWAVMSQDPLLDPSRIPIPGSNLTAFRKERTWWCCALKLLPTHFVTYDLIGGCEVLLWQLYNPLQRSEGDQRAQGVMDPSLERCHHYHLQAKCNDAENSADAIILGLLFASLRTTQDGVDLKKTWARSVTDLKVSTGLCIIEDHPLWRRSEEDLDKVCDWPKGQ